MSAVLKYLSASGEEKEVCAYSFKWVDFEGAKIVSGDKYYVDKACELGAEKPKRKRKTKE